MIDGHRVTDAEAYLTAGAIWDAGGRRQQDWSVFTLAEQSWLQRIL
jgi:hypothetical protein